MSKFSSVWLAIGGCVPPERIFADLVQRYSESHRAYHTLTHINECLLELDAVWDKIQNPEAVAIALWYHDAIYDTTAKDNELQSAILAKSLLNGAGIARGFSSMVSRLILATKHDAVPTLSDEQYMVDIDLSILGKPEEQFAAYELQIRKEYSWVPDALFNAKRKEILEGFLRRGSIYATVHFQDFYEAQAIRNIQASIRSLV